MTAALLLVIGLPCVADSAITLVARLARYVRAGLATYFNGEEVVA